MKAFKNIIQGLQTSYTFGEPHIFSGFRDADISRMRTTNETKAEVMQRHIEGQSTSYVILGEILNTVQRTASSNPIQQTNLLRNVGKTQYLYSALPLVLIYGMVKAHSIDQVIKEIEDVKKYNTIKDRSRNLVCL